MLKRLKGFSGIVICTGNVAHTMVEGTVYGASKWDPYRQDTL